MGENLSIPQENFIKVFTMEKFKCYFLLTLGDAAVYRHVVVAVVSGHSWAC